MDIVGQVHVGADECGAAAVRRVAGYASREGLVHGCAEIWLSMLRACKRAFVCEAGTRQGPARKHPPRASKESLMTHLCATLCIPLLTDHGVPESPQSFLNFVQAVEVSIAMIGYLLGRIASSFATTTQIIDTTKIVALN